MGAADLTVPSVDQLVDLRTSASSPSHVVDTLIPVVQRSAGRAAPLRDPHLEITVGPTGAVVARFVVSASR